MLTYKGHRATFSCNPGSASTLISASFPYREEVLKSFSISVRDWEFLAHQCHHLRLHWDILRLAHQRPFSYPSPTSTVYTWATSTAHRRHPLKLRARRHRLLTHSGVRSLPPLLGWVHALGSGSARGISPNFSSFPCSFLYS